MKIACALIVFCLPLAILSGGPTAAPHDNAPAETTGSSETVYSDAFYSASEPEARVLAEKLKAKFGLEAKCLVRAGPKGDYVFPKLETAVSPQWPTSVFVQKKEEVVSVLGIIDVSGKINEATVTKTTDVRLNSAAIETLKKWVFSPARYKGVPVHATVEVPIYFKLQSPESPNSAL